MSNCRCEACLERAERHNPAHDSLAQSLVHIHAELTLLREDEDFTSRQRRERRVDSELNNAVAEMLNLAWVHNWQGPGIGALRALEANA